MESTPFYLSYAALWILVILHSLILLGVVRIVYQLQQTGGSSSLSLGKEAPVFNAVDLFGTPIRSTDFVGHALALLFVSPSCPSCATILEEDMAYLNHKGQGNVIVICRAGREDCIQLARQHRLDIPTIADENDQISRLYDISTVPTVVLIDVDNRILSYGQPEREKTEEAFKVFPEIKVEGTD